MLEYRKEIYPLTSIRFFAAVLVFLEHVKMLPGIEWIGTRHIGAVGVSIFFVLSGYIITYSYCHRNWQADYKGNARDFFWSRFARIFPLHWLTFLIALPLGLNSNTARVNIAEFPLLLTLTDRLWPGYLAGSQPVKVAWTLSCESLFYLLSPLLLLLVAGKSRPLLRIVLILIGYTALAVFLALLFPKLNWSAYLRVPEFLLGIAGYYIASRFRLDCHAKSLLAGGVILLVIAFIAHTKIDLQFYYFAYAIGALVLILGFANTSGRLRDHLSHPLLVLLGHSSFSFYLLHDPVLRYAKVFLNRADIVLPQAASVLVTLAFFVLLSFASILCFKFYENPVRLKLRSLLKCRSARISASGPE